MTHLDTDELRGFMDRSMEAPMSALEAAEKDVSELYEESEARFEQVMAELKAYLDEGRNKGAFLRRHKDLSDTEIDALLETMTDLKKTMEFVDVDIDEASLESAQAASMEELRRATWQGLLDEGIFSEIETGQGDPAFKEED